MKKQLRVEYIKYRKARNHKGKRDRYAAQSKGKATGNGTGHSGNVRITPANVNDVDPVPDILDDIEKRLGHLPTYMGVDAG